MSEKEISVSFEELNRLEVYCPSCKAGILLDLSAGSAAKQIGTTMCPSCAKDRLPQNLVSAYQDFIDKVRQSGATLKFRIKES